MLWLLSYRVVWWESIMIESAAFWQRLSIRNDHMYSCTIYICIIMVKIAPQNPYSNALEKSVCVIPRLYIRFEHKQFTSDSEHSLRIVRNLFKHSYIFLFLPLSNQIQRCLWMFSLPAPVFVCCVLSRNGTFFAIFVYSNWANDNFVRSIQLLSLYSQKNFFLANFLYSTVF